MTGVSTRVLYFSDIEGSTAMLQRVGRRYVDLLARHRTLVREASGPMGAIEEGTEGDSFFMTFSSPESAITAAAAVQLSHQREPWPADGSVRVRIGLHVGEVSDTAAGPVGLPIHHAARIMGCAHGGQIVASDQIRVATDTLPSGLGFRSLGEFRLRDVGVVPLHQVTHPDLEDQFPPLRAIGSRLDNLPAALTSFVGRESEMAELKALLSARRLVTLIGPGGCGKTRLATRVASELGSVHPDGVWLVNLLDSMAAGGVIGALSRALGLRGPGVLDELFTGKTMLLVIDNCEHVIAEAADVVAQLLSLDSGVTVLATSREPLRVAGEAMQRVGPLGLPRPGSGRAAVMTSQAGTLFTERATLVKHDFVLTDDDAEAVGEICRALDGLPLAIELAAARAGSISVTDISRLLGDRFRLLTGGPRTATAHQQTLRATVAWSFDLLTPSEQELLMRLAVFPGSFDHESAEHVCGPLKDGPQDLVDVIWSLHDKSLLISDADSSMRLRVPETIRQFTWPRVPVDQQRELEHDHARWFVDGICALGNERAVGSVERLCQFCDVERDSLSIAVQLLAGREPERALHAAVWMMRAASVSPGLLYVAPLLQDVLQNAGNVSVDELAIGLAFASVNAMLGLVSDDHRTHAQQAFARLEHMPNLVVRAEVAALIEYQESMESGVDLDEATVQSITQNADASALTLTRIWTRDILARVSPTELSLRLISQAVQIAEDAGEPALAQTLRPYSAILMGDLGFTNHALDAARASLSGLRDLITTGRVDTEILALIALLEGEHGELSTGLNLAEDLAMSVASRPHNRRDLAAATSIVARLRLLADDLTGSEASARQAIELLAADRVVSFISGNAHTTLAAVRRRRGDLAGAAHALAAIAASPAAGHAARLLEEGARVALALDRSQTAADLLATATQLRTRRSRMRTPVERAEVEELVVAVSHIDGRMLSAEAAASAVRSLQECASDAVEGR